MNRNYRVALGISIFITLFFIAPALSIFTSISTDPFGWQAGIATDSTILYAVAIIIGYGYLLFQNFLAFFGLFLKPKSKTKALWLLVIPGLIGILLGILWLVLFILIDPEWPSSWPITAVLLIPPVTAFVIGRNKW